MEMSIENSLKPIQALSRTTLNFRGPTTASPSPISNFGSSGEHPSFPSLPEINRWVITDDGGETLRIDFEEPAPRRPVISESVPRRKPIMIESRPTASQVSEENDKVYPDYALGEIRSKKQARKIIDANDCSREPCNHCAHLGLVCFRHYQYRVCAFCRSNNWGREECCAVEGGNEDGDGEGVGHGSGEPEYRSVDKRDNVKKERGEKNEVGSGQRYWWT